MIVDYTSRDFDSIFEDLKGLIPKFLPEWTSRADTDFGISLLQLFSYVADGLHYYADRLANEAYLDTATQRASVLSIAKLLDYTPTGNVAATVDLQFTNSGTLAVVVPAGTQVLTASGGTASLTSSITFETTESATVAPSGGTATVSAHEGRTVVSEALGVSNGDVVLTFGLFEQPVIDGSVTVFVDEGSGPTQWLYQQHMLDAGANDEAFTLSTNDRGQVFVVFGDGANGRIPSIGSPVTATYRVGGGTAGNVPANVITQIVSGLPGGMAVTNPAAAIGGADAESIDSIRFNAPANLLTLQRAVTLNDYARIAVSVPGVAKAKASSTVNTSVNVYVAPTGGGGFELDGVTPTTAFTALKTSVATALTAAKPANTSVTVLDPTYVPINVSLTVHVLPRYRQDLVADSVKAALSDLFAFDNVVFGDRVTPSDVHLVVAPVPGVEYIDLTVLAAAPATTVGVVSLATGEIPVLTTAPTLTLTGGILP